MKRVRFYAIAALLVIASPVSPGSSITAKSSGPEHGAGCHEAPPSQPAPNSPSHECCSTGHDTLAASSKFSVHTTPPISPLYVSDNLALTRLDPLNGELLRVAASPPSAAPLRI